MRVSPKIFQSTLPHGERQLTERQNRKLLHYFNPRSRMGSDVQEADNNTMLDISIHAPAWGATFVIGIIHRAINISIHAPAWGATPPLARLLVDLMNFNPRSRMGSDYRTYFSSREIYHFNPRSRMGSDPAFRQ